MVFLDFYVISIQYLTNDKKKQHNIFASLNTVTNYREFYG